MSRRLKICRKCKNFSESLSGSWVIGSRYRISVFRCMIGMQYKTLIEDRITYAGYYQREPPDECPFLLEQKVSKVAKKR
jgi:hypothetical protein